MLELTHDISDDWRGITNPAERRKRQNRLNQRAKRHREEFERNSLSLVSHEAAGFRLDVDQCSSYSSGSVIAVRTRRLPLTQGYEALLPMHSDTRHLVVELIRQYFSGHATSLLKAPSNASNLARMNLLVAVSNNANALGISWTCLEQGDSVSLFNRIGPSPMDGQDWTRADFLPQDLRPTLLQRSMVHHPWIDGLPFAVMRDNILSALEKGVIDKDELCESMFIATPGEGALAPVVVWGPAEDQRNWEFSPNFFARWAELMIGCPEVLEITNDWRQRRGQRMLRLTQ